MSTLLLVGRWVSSASFTLLALVTFSQWVNRRDLRNLYLALAVGLLAVVSLAGNVVALPRPQALLTGSPLVRTLVNDVLLVAFLLSGYALLLFRTAIIPFGKRGQRVVWGALALGLAAGLVPQPMPGQPPNGIQTAALLYVVGFWCACVGEPVVRLWLRSRELPAVQRARLRSFAVGYGLIVAILVVSVVLGAAAKDPRFQLMTQFVTLLVVPVLYASFAPPRWLRRAWRAKEEDELARGIRDFMLFSSEPAVLAERAVSWGERLVGGQGGAIIAPSGQVLAAHGIDEAAASTMS